MEVAGVASEVLNTGVVNMSANMNRLEEYGWNSPVSGDSVSGVLNRVWVEPRSGVYWVEVWSETAPRILKT